MSKTTKIFLIVAAVCLIVGIILTVGYLIFGKARGLPFPRAQTYTETRLLADPMPEAIELREVSRDVRIVLSEDDRVTFTYYQSENTRYSFAEKDGKLVITYCQDDFVPISSDGTRLASVLALPASYAGSLSIYAVSSDVTLRNVTVEKEARIETVSGDVTLLGTNILGKTDISTTSGEVELQNAKTGALSVKSVSGEIEGERVTANGDLAIHVTSGDIEFDGLTAGNVKIDTISAEVSLSLTGSDKYSEIRTKTISGKVNVPTANGTGNVIDISTTSGDIAVSFIR